MVFPHLASFRMIYPVLVLSVILSIDISQSSSMKVPESDPERSEEGLWTVEWIIPKNYNKLLAPKTLNGEPVTVQISMNISQLVSIQEDQQTFTVAAFYSQTWTDKRVMFPQGLESDHLGLDFSWREKLWVPDTYFHNAIGGSGINILAAPYNFILTNDSRISMNLRTVIKLTCDMDLRLFPHDSQVCDIILVSCKPTLYWSCLPKLLP